jgi:hypothetical protein
MHRLCIKKKCEWIKRQKGLILPFVLDLSEAQFERRLGTQNMIEILNKNRKNRTFSEHQFSTKKEKTSSPHLKFKLRRRAPQMKQNDPCAWKEKTQLYPLQVSD